MSLFSWLHLRILGRPHTRQAPSRKPAPHFRPRLECLERRDVPSTLTVTSPADSGAGTLRADIAAAQPGDTVNFAPSLNGQTIKLTTGELVINKSLTVQGPGAGQLAISGNNAYRVFDVYGSSTNVTLSGLTITQGNANSNLHPGDRGAILNSAGSTLTINGCTLSGNHAPIQGGGIANLAATLNVTNSTISGNYADYNGRGEGGGVYSSGDNLSMTHCTLSGNHTPFEGGAIWISNTMTTINGCTLSGNAAPSGSAIYNTSMSNMLTIIDSIFSNNSPTSQFPIAGAWNGSGNTFA